MSKIDELLEYALNTPGNLNPSVFRTMAEGLDGSDSGESGDDLTPESNTFKFSYVNTPDDLPEESNNGDLCLTLIGETKNDLINLANIDKSNGLLTFEEGYLTLGTPIYVQDLFGLLLTTINQMEPEYKAASGTYQIDDDHRIKYYSYDSQEQTYTDITDTLHEGDSLQYYYYDENQIKKQLTMAGLGTLPINEISIIPINENLYSDLYKYNYYGKLEAEITDVNLQNSIIYDYYCNVEFADPATSSFLILDSVEKEGETFRKILYQARYYFQPITYSEDFSFDTGWSVVYLYLNSSDEIAGVEVESFSSLDQIIPTSILTISPAKYIYQNQILSGYEDFFSGILKHIYFENASLYANINGWTKIDSIEILAQTYPLSENNNNENNDTENNDPVAGNDEQELILPDNNNEENNNDSAQLVPVWDWGIGNTTATATFTVDGQEYVVDATVSKEDDGNGGSIYVATAEFNGETYTAIQNDK